jgi:hypothetical protein
MRFFSRHRDEAAGLLILCSADLYISQFRPLTPSERLIRYRSSTADADFPSLSLPQPSLTC